MPSSGIARRLNFPRADDQALCLQCSMPVRGGEDSDWLLTCVDPYTGTLAGQRVQARADRIFPDNWVWLLIGLHTSLLAGSTGLYTVTIIAVLLMISVLTGLYLWWPPPGKWRQALTIKPQASAERRNFDLHKTFGSYWALVLLVLLFTGIYTNLPQYVKPLVELARHGVAGGSEVDTRAGPDAHRARPSAGHRRAPVPRWRASHHATAHRPRRSL